MLARDGVIRKKQHSKHIIKIQRRPTTDDNHQTETNLPEIGDHGDDRQGTDRGDHSTQGQTKYTSCSQSTGKRSSAVHHNELV